MRDRTDALLARAVTNPTHAYLLAGPPGCGMVEAARELAGRLVADGTDDERALDLARRSLHPDVYEFATVETQIRKEQVLEILYEASRSPVEGARKVVMVHDVERFNDTTGNQVLKTVEEPPPRTVFVLTSSRISDVLITIRSRCQQIDFATPSDDEIVERLRARGVDDATAGRIAGLAGGNIERAVALAGPVGAVRFAFATMPGEVDGTGGRASTLIAEAETAIERVATAVQERHEHEREELDVMLERGGYDTRAARSRRSRLTDAHKRELTRLRRELLLEGVTAIESVYRDELADPAPPKNDDIVRHPVGARRAADAIDACRIAREALLVNEKGSVHLLRLLLHLPVPRHR